MEKDILLAKSAEEMVNAAELSVLLLNAAIAVEQAS